MAGAAGGVAGAAAGVDAAGGRKQEKYGPREVLVKNMFV